MTVRRREIAKKHIMKETALSIILEVLNVSKSFDILLQTFSFTSSIFDTIFYEFKRQACIN
jgi:hypothetical protein